NAEGLGLARYQDLVLRIDGGPERPVDDEVRLLVGLGAGPAQVGQAGGEGGESPDRPARAAGALLAARGEADGRGQRRERRKGGHPLPKHGRLLSSRVNSWGEPQGA